MSPRLWSKEFLFYQAQKYQILEKLRKSASTVKWGHYIYQENQEVAGAKERKSSFPLGFHLQGNLQASSESEASLLHIGYLNAVLPLSSERLVSAPLKSLQNLQFKGRSSALLCTALTLALPSTTPTPTAPRAAEPSGSCSSGSPRATHFRVRPEAQPLSRVGTLGIVAHRSLLKLTPRDLADADANGEDQSSLSLV